MNIIITTNAAQKIKHHDTKAVVCHYQKQRMINIMSGVIPDKYRTLKHVIFESIDGDWITFSAVTSRGKDVKLHISTRG